MPELAISTDKVAFLIEKAREFDVKESDADADSGSNGADDNMVDVLEDTGEDPVVQEIAGFISAMTEEEQIDLVALMRLGRGDGSIEGNHRDAPGYFLDDVDHAQALICEMAIPNLKLQFDVYHCQILHGDVTTRLREMLPVIGHIQVASVPSRHEPDDEELNYPFLFAELDRLGYAGFVGAEYRPRGKTEDGLGWFKPYRAGT
jgi:hypothetical protein